MRRIIGAFIFPDVWLNWTESEAIEIFESLRRFGVNTIFTESESYRNDLIDLAHQFDLYWFGGIACFQNNQHVHDRPELWPINENGEGRTQMEWYIGVTPTFEDYNQSRLDLAEKLVKNHPLDGFFLDFIRWPIHWELELRPNTKQPLQSSFDPHTLTRFQIETGIEIPKHLQDTPDQAAWILNNHAKAWENFRCDVITSFVDQASTRLRAIRGDGLTLGLYVLPLPPAPLAKIAGQRLSDLSSLVDLIAPMTYHAIQHQSAQWVQKIVQQTAEATPGQVLPVLQVSTTEAAAANADWGPPVSVKEWEEVVRQSQSVSETCGLVAFTGTALFYDGRGECLASLLHQAS